MGNHAISFAESAKSCLSTDSLPDRRFLYSKRTVRCYGPDCSSECVGARQRQMEPARVSGDVLCYFSDLHAGFRCAIFGVRVSTFVCSEPRMGDRIFNFGRYLSCFRVLQFLDRNDALPLSIYLDFSYADTAIRITDMGASKSVCGLLSLSKGCGPARGLDFDKAGQAELVETKTTRKPVGVQKGRYGRILSSRLRPLGWPAALPMGIPETGDLRGQKDAVSVPTGWLLAILFCLGAFLRIYNFRVPDLWVDEYGTWWAVAAGDWSGVLHRVISIHGQSPLYYFIVKLSTNFLGAGPFSLRLPSVLFGIGLLALVYPLGLRIFRDRHAALLALAAFSVNQMMIWYSQEARPYAAAIFFTMLSFLFYLSLLKSEKLAYSLGYILATSAAYYVHYLFAFIVVIQVIHLFATRGWSWLCSKTWLLSFLFFVVLCIPGGLHLIGLFQRRESLNFVSLSVWNGWREIAVEFLDPYIFFGTIISVIFIRLSGGKREEPPQKETEKKLLISWLLVPLLAFSLLPYLFRVNLLYHRYLLFAAPAALFIFAWLMASGGKTGWRRWLPLAAFLTLTLFLHLIPALRTSGGFAFRPDQGWARAADYLKTYGQTGDLVILGTGFVEANSLAKPDPVPLTISFISWPLTAHLTPDDRYRVINLSQALNNQTRAYIASVHMEAAKHSRVWVIGMPELTPMFASKLVTVSSFHLLQQAFFGDVQVYLLAKQAK